MYFAYLDEFGHVGPYLGRDNRKFNESPVFGLGGIIIPAREVRSFATWFYQLKSNLLGWEIERSGEAPYWWEKKARNYTQHATSSITASCARRRIGFSTKSLQSAASAYTSDWRSIPRPKYTIPSPYTWPYSAKQLSGSIRFVSAKAVSGFF